MGKAKPSANTLNSPTASRPTDDAGRELDEFGLPINGPARLRALAGRPDPCIQSEATASDAGSAPIAAPAPTGTETQNG